MIDFNLFVIGRIGKDASINETNGRKAINFAVAHNSSYKDKNGTEVQKTVWINCTMWRDKDDNATVANYLKSGTQVAVQGDPSVRTYTNSDGVSVAAMDLHVTGLKLLSSVKEKEDGSGN